MAKRLGQRGPRGKATTAERVIVALLLVASLLFVTYCLVHGQDTKQDRLEQGQ
jgi:hypothetical protein